MMMGVDDGHLPGIAASVGDAGRIVDDDRGVQGDLAGNARQCRSPAVGAAKTPATVTRQQSQTASGLLKEPPRTPSNKIETSSHNEFRGRPTGRSPSRLLPPATPSQTTKEFAAMAKTPRRIRRTPSGMTLPRTSDGRSQANRRIKELTLALEHDLAGVTMTTALRGMVTAAVVSTVAVEKMRDDLAAGLPVDMDRATAITSNLETTLRQLEAAKHAASATVVA
jgi:hypothetical protein